MVFLSLHTTDVGPLLGSRVQEQLGKEVRPALDAALTMAGGKDVHLVVLMFCCRGKTGTVWDGFMQYHDSTYHFSTCLDVSFKLRISDILRFINLFST